MAVEMQFRTTFNEQFSEMRDRWSSGDNEQEYASVEDALERSDYIHDWQDDSRRGDLTSVRLRDLETGDITYVSPTPQQKA